MYHPYEEQPKRGWIDGWMYGWMDELCVAYGVSGLPSLLHAQQISVNSLPVIKYVDPTIIYHLVFISLLFPVLIVLHLIVVQKCCSLCCTLNVCCTVHTRGIIRNKM